LQNLDTKNLQQQLDDVRKKIDLATTNIEINTIIENFVCSLVGSEFCSLWFYDQQKLLLVRNREDNSKNELSMDIKEGIIHKCFMSKKAAIYNYLASERDYVAAVDNPDSIKIKSKIILPLLDGENLVGILTAYSSVKKSKKFTQKDQNLLEAFAPYLMRVVAKMYSLDIMQEQDPVAQKIKDYSEVEKKVESEDEKFHTMANFIHDIRTPANTLQGFLELLESQIEDKRLKEYLVNAKESAMFINELTTSMLENIKLDQETKMFKTLTIDTMKFFADIAEMFASNMYTKNICFNIFIDPRLPKKITTDDVMLKRVLMNLLSNAYKFTPYGKKIDFSVTYNQKEQNISVEIKDTGIGIAKEKQKEIFKAFKQAEDMTSLQYGGTGLGLAICSKYISDLGGELKIKSKLEKGTTFYFDIPAKIEKYEATIEPFENSSAKVAVLMRAKNNNCMINVVRNMVSMGIKKENITLVMSVDEVPKNVTNLVVFQSVIDNKVEEIMKRTSKVLIVEEELFSIQNEELPKNVQVASQYTNMAHDIYQFLNIEKIPRVLIVDDDRTSVVLLERILESEYCQVESVDNGKVALEMLIDSHKKEEPYNIIYIDNHMPLMSGKEVLKNLREFEKDNNLYPIYAVSTSGNPIEIDKERRDFNLHIGKPFRVDEIRKALLY